MLAVMKKDMSSSLHSNADLSRSHACLQAALKLRDRPTRLPALADLASHVLTMLLMLPLPAKVDTGMTAIGLQCSLNQPINQFTFLVFRTRQGSQQTITGTTRYNMHLMFKAFDNRAAKQ